MKDLKFRAWHIESEKYLKVAGIDFEGSFIYVNENGYGAQYFFKEIILEQYTNLKDDNGKDIYERDIVELTFNNTYVERTNVRTLKDFLSWNWHSITNVKIVGNVNTKELLE